jgi:PEGA domain
MQPQQGYYPQPGYSMPMAAQAVQPHALYGMQPRPMPSTLTGQLRLSEVDEIPQSYKLGSNRKRWFGLVVAAIVAISLAAGITFFIIRATRDATPVVAIVKIESSPSGADVYYDDTRLSDRTPLTIENVPTGTRHDIKVQLSHYKAYTDTVDIPKTGGTVPVMALLKKLTGKIVINSKPDGAEILINGEVRGRTPKTIEDIDMDSAKTLDVRLKDHPPISRTLEWPANGQIDLDLKFDK